jgi:DNA helicase-2/ATP-dependent DNA helicase PcrA
MKVKAALREGVKGSDMAVIYRTNSQSRALEDSFRRERIDYHIVAGIKFYERKEVKDLLSYMRVVVNPKDSLALARIINVPTRGIGATSLRKIEDEAVRLNLSLWELVERVVSQPTEHKHVGLSAKVMSSLGGLVTLIHEVQVLEAGPNPLPSYSYEKLLHESGYLEMLKADRSHEGAARLENLDELLTALKSFEGTTDTPTLIGFLETITLDSEKQVDVNASVGFMTAHGSKGLEYLRVFIAGAEDNLFPSFRSLESGGTAVEEERRLFYVAMTRAMEHLTITFAQGRMLWGSLKFNGPSQFVGEIPAAYFEKKFHGTGPVAAPVRHDEFDQRSHDDDSYGGPVLQQRRSPARVSALYVSGQKVLHALYGQGTVLESEGAGADEKILIMFRDGVKKRFMVKFAPLQRVEEAP